MKLVELLIPGADMFRQLSPQDANESWHALNNMVRFFKEVNVNFPKLLTTENVTALCAFEGDSENVAKALRLCNMFGLPLQDCFDCFIATGDGFDAVCEAMNLLRGYPALFTLESIKYICEKGKDAEEFADAMITKRKKEIADEVNAN